MTVRISVDRLIDEAFSYHRGGRLDEAEALYRTALEIDSDNFQALQLLGTLALRSERMSEALTLLGRALVILEQRGGEAPRHASLYNNMGIALRASGQRAQAAERFRKGLELDPDLIELHVSLGGVLVELGDFTGAADCFKTALILNPNLPGCLCDLATIYGQTGRLEEAIAFYRRVLLLDPLHWPARFNLAQMLRRMEEYDEALSLLRGLLEESPENLSVHSQLGIAYAAANRLDLSLTHFRLVLARRAENAEALQYVANIQQTMGYTEEADQNYRRSLELRPLITIESIKSPPDFRALLLFAPGAGNTPLECLIGRANYENNILNFLPGVTYDIGMLRERTDVIVNLIADVDQSCALLAPAAALIERIGKPTINHPQKILQTYRESVAARLAATINCSVPQTRRYAGTLLCAPDFVLTQTLFSFPFLARLAGTHGGVDFEKIHTTAELNAFVSRHPEADYYLSDYVDYRSADGLFRKYRFIFIGEEILPYHLAIDSKWKIHHVTTDMVNQPWMQQEEKYFLENPNAVFGSAQYAALRAIQKRIDLDYFGIDCALDREGRIVVFEVNACMLVHQHNEQFPYKTEPVRLIKATFDSMLKRRAVGE